MPRRGNEETRCASGRQRGDAVCLGEATGRCSVGRQRVRCGVPRGGDLREVLAGSSLLLARVALWAPRGLLHHAYIYTPLPR